MFGKFGDMMGKLQEMKQKADEIKSSLDAINLLVDSAGRDIHIKINGNRKILHIEIAPALQHGDKAILEKELLVAINKAIETADKINESEMKKAASGLIPGL